MINKFVRANLKKCMPKSLIHQQYQKFHNTKPNAMLKQLIANTGRLKPSEHYFKEIHVVNEVFSESGAIAQVPQWYKFGLAKLFLTFTVFLLVGAQLSKTGTKFLEENDIFKPEEDDDEEDD
jgi:hypothetical protein